MPNPTSLTVEQRLLAPMRQREVNMIGAGISKRCWHEVETAYNQLRDKIDEALRPPALISARDGIEARYGLNDVYPGDMVSPAKIEADHLTSTDRLRDALEEIRDLLTERIYGNPARSPAHNARVKVDSLLSALTSTPAPSWEREALASVGRTLNFFASVIKSGEPWTSRCQEAFDRAHAVLSARAALQGHAS